MLILARAYAAALQQPEKALVAASLLLRCATSILLVVVGSLLPSFATDAEPLLRPVSRWVEPIVRWDTVHFVNIALEGYKVEKQTAFMPGLPALLRVGAHLSEAAGAHHETLRLDSAVLVGAMVTIGATTGAAVALHRLTSRLYPERPAFAVTSAVLFLLAPARPVLHGVPYTEPFSAFLTFAGMLRYAQDADLAAALLWAVGTLFRAQGAVIGIGFFGWKFLLRHSFDGAVGVRAYLARLIDNLPRFIFFSLLSAAPFLAFEAYVYRDFCLDGSLPSRPWCTEGLGFSYSWVQREYWDVGPFRYWNLLQLPNFALAAPVLALSFAASLAFYRSNLSLTQRSTVPFLALPPWAPAARRPAAPFSSPRSAAQAVALVPFVHLHTATTLLLFVSAHVQIVLRVCATGPVVWWYAAELVERSRWWRARTGRTEDAEKGDESEQVEKGRDWGRVWIWYSLVWGTIATLLWAVALPPA
ncbi:GPI-anchor transamidase GPI18 [Rhodotorula paludigena]|uniref:GPI-anchor transamidase GPI18 n=1 Tax=Rhodotorula paludigena TaxID=86838 RepID=UPI0031820402